MIANVELVPSLGVNLTATDFFCGAGGASTGLVEAGFEVITAANHWDRAIETHAANHPGTEHICADINNYDMRRLPRTRVLWASVICTEISPAGGRKRRRHAGNGQLGFEELEKYGAIKREGYERTRATALDVIRATEVHRYEIVVVENVVEFAVEWQLFDWWRSGMQILGYSSQVISVSSAHVGAPGVNDPAAQWRDRIFIVFTRKGVPVPQIAPRPLAWCEKCGQDVESMQSWRNGNTIGKYRQQYDYRCPNSACGHRVVEPYVAPAASIIDWENPGVRIGDRAAHGLRKMAAKTRARIQAGLIEHGPLITLAAAGNTYERRPGVRSWPADHPLTTLTATAQHGFAGEPFLFSVNQDGANARAVPAFGSPLVPRTVRIGDGLVVPIGGTWNEQAYPAGNPMRTVTTRETSGVVTPPEVAASFIAELRGGGSSHRPVMHPFATFNASGRHHGLVIPFRKAKASPVTEPLHTLGTVDSAGIARASGVPVVEVDDCYFRMITPRESLLAQRFPSAYIVHGNQGEQTMQAGNAVSVNVARWVGERVAAALSGGAA